MATTVTVLCPNGRRVNIKVTPATTLLQVLEQVCEKQKFDPAYHTLKHHNKSLDLNNLFRYTNLPQNAKMEMVPTDKPRTESSEVTLAVQCEDGRRVQGKFDPSATSLWGVLTKLGVCEFEGGRLEPVVAYTNNQICGETALQKKTLRALGLTSGRAVIRLLFRERQAQGSQPEEVAQQEEVPADVKTESSGGETEAQTKQEDVSEEVKLKTVTLSEDQPMETEDDEQPKSKPKAVTQTGPSSQSGNSVSSKTGQTGSTDSTAGGASGDVDMPYFPAHPISYFPDDVESSASAAARPPPARLSAPVSMFDQQFSLFDIDENGPPLQVPTLEPFKFPAVTSMLQTSNAPPPPPKVYDEPCERERVVFHLDTSLPSPSVEVPDEFFNVTVQDVQRIHEDHKKQLESFSDAPLMTQTMKMAQMEKKYESYGKAVVRVHFPDRWVLQGCFRPRESLKALVRFIRDNMADPQVKFHLYTTPPKEVLKNGKMTFIEAGFVPAAIVYVGVESSHAPDTLLSEDSLKAAQSGLEAEVVVAKKRELKQDSPSSLLPSQRPRPVKSKASGRGVGGVGGGASTGETRKVPKWFKMGK